MAKPSRRSVLRAGLLLAAGTAPIGVAQQALSAVLPGNGLRRSSFTPLLRKPFVFVGERGTHRAVLVEVSDLPTAARGHDARFRLLFRIGGTPEQGIYAVRHWTMEDTPLFVAPVAGRADLYEAVIDAVVPVRA